MDPMQSPGLIVRLAVVGITLALGLCLLANIASKRILLPGEARPSPKPSVIVKVYEPPTPTFFPVDPQVTAGPHEVLKFLEPPPMGLTWEPIYDWDGSVIRKCLIVGRPPGLFIDSQINRELGNPQPPKGYHWQRRETPHHPVGVATILCVQRLACPLGKKPQSEESLPPPGR
jgi:hypothetical protein